MLSSVTKFEARLIIWQLLTAVKFCHLACNISWLCLSDFTIGEKLVRKSRGFMWVIFILLLQESFLTFIITGRANTHQNLWRSFSVICAHQNDRRDGSSQNHWRSNAWYRSYKIMFTWPRPEATKFYCDWFYWLTEARGVRLLLNQRMFWLWRYGCILQLLINA